MCACVKSGADETCTYAIGQCLVAVFQGFTVVPKIYRVQHAVDSISMYITCNTWPKGIISDENLPYFTWKYSWSLRALALKTTNIRPWYKRRSATVCLHVTRNYFNMATSEYKQRRSSHQYLSSPSEKYQEQRACNGLRRQVQNSKIPKGHLVLKLQWRMKCRYYEYRFARSRQGTTSIDRLSNRGFNYNHWSYQTDPIIWKRNRRVRTKRWWSLWMK